MEYKQAKEIAIRVFKAIEPFTTKCDIAGSVRREKPDVKDIEICCTPRITNITDLFGDVLGTKRVSGFYQIVQMQGKILKGSIADGRYVQIALHDGINLDLFMPVESDYYRQFAIRTGSADYSHKVLATSWLKTGWCGTENGLRLQSESYQKDLGNGKHKWICDNPNPTLPPIFDSEYSLFKFLSLDWIEPKKRNV